ncbi:MAG TPA: ATP synthase subunit I [Gallionella sp.]|nr:ATP synthase subunit I [Gallionella sp.]
MAGNVDQRGLTLPQNAAIIAALCDAETKEKKMAKWVVVTQALVVLVAVGVAYSMKSTLQFAIAVLSGGGVSVLNGALLAWRMSGATLRLAHSAHHQLRLMYFYAAERFLAVTLSLGLCVTALKLLPLATLGGFVAGQAALLAARLLFIRFEVVTKNGQ